MTLHYSALASKDIRRTALLTISSALSVPSYVTDVVGRSGQLLLHHVSFWMVHVKQCVVCYILGVSQQINLFQTMWCCSFISSDSCKAS
jgi:hypothetical protein